MSCHNKSGRHASLDTKYKSFENPPALDDVPKSAVQNNGLALQYVKNQTDEICNLAVQENELALQYVKNPTNKKCRAN